MSYPKIEELPEVLHFEVMPEDFEPVWRLLHVALYPYESLLPEGYSAWSYYEDHREYLGEVFHNNGWRAKNYSDETCPLSFETRGEAIAALIGYVMTEEWPSLT